MSKDHCESVESQAKKIADAPVDVPGLLFFGKMLRFFFFFWLFGGFLDVLEVFFFMLEGFRSIFLLFNPLVFDLQLFWLVVSH